MEKLYWTSVYKNSYWFCYTVDTKLKQFNLVKNILIEIFNSGNARSKLYTIPHKRVLCLCSASLEKGYSLHMDTMCNNC